MRRAFFAVVLTLCWWSGGVVSASDWQSQYISDHLMGRIGVGAFVGGMLEGAGRRPETAILGAYCANNSTVVNIESKQVFFGSSGPVIRYRLDDGPVQMANWDVCRDSRCVGLWRGQGIPFLKSLFGKKELKVVVELHFSAPLNGTFHVEGAEAALEEVGQACGWLPKAKK